MNIGGDLLINYAKEFENVGEDLESAARRLQQSRLKRLIDVVGAAAGLIFLLPFLLLVALAIWIESPGPIIFRQRRTGYNGVTFIIYKFRSMHVLEDGEEIKQAERHDRRNTRFGRILRRTSIDELPQLLNVLKGEMSLVGPRPHALAHDEYYSAILPAYVCRFMAKPGITGLSQMSGLRGETTQVVNMADRVAMDLEYIVHWSIGLDLQILVQTLLLVPFQTAAY